MGDFGVATNQVNSIVDAPVRLAVTGDTHLGRRRTWLPRDLLEGIRSADAIIHTGDFSTVQAWELFRAVGPVYAVSGNNDDAALAVMLPQVLRLEVGDRSIVVVHGHLERGRNAREAVISKWTCAADIVVFGHSHQPYREEVDGTLFLNPGSPTMRRREPRFSFAILDIRADGSFDAEMCFFDDQKPASPET